MEVKMPDEALTAIIEREKLYSLLIEQSSEIIIIHQNHQVLYINDSGSKALRGTKEEIVGASVLDIIKEEYKEAIVQRIQRVMATNQPAQLIEQTMRRLDGTPIDVEVNCSPITYRNQRAIQSVLRDITSRKEAERKQQELMKEINSISAPIVPVSEGVSILPLVGSIDARRAKQLAEDIPGKIQDFNVEYLIIDFSGTYNIDNFVAEYLFQISKTISLLGIKPILTGLRPELARKVVDIGVDLSALHTMATVQQAVNHLSRISK
ncbi:PAS domain S-box protein [Planomicrobium sp. CPCC 101110]|uniref:PAS domain S-box protein n=1 Tax=Planomicrobium sp. CPCC 101110 TaxID=2599619 RepID=UPI0011B7427C|nr:PAS domain S-box protein [Planomicrobium sp. CPCC 101110]TWT26021.1 PAS domain S-box protein [Planomicrobium sp. CPCC 101110]